MKAKESISFQFNQVDWKASVLGENVMLLQAPKSISIDKIHHSSHAIEETLGQQLLDIVPAYDSIAIFSEADLNQVVETLENYHPEESKKSTQSNIIEIPICYELGVDLEHLSAHTGLSKEKIIETHLSGTYRSLFIGFTPGFIYADGLDPSLACPRKSNPRTHIHAGSIGIGGAQTGIYSLDSPGGWNIIGRTPMSLFDIQKDPPMAVEVGTSFRFERISKEQLDSWES